VPFTQTDKDNLDAVHAQGMRRLHCADRDVEWESVDDYLKLRALMDADIALAAGKWQVRHVRMDTSNGWGH
jgi:hypothetical protein